MATGLYLASTVKFRTCTDKEYAAGYVYKPLMTSDDFNYAPGEKLHTAWQWNHTPDNTLWSATERRVAAASHR